MTALSLFFFTLFINQVIVSAAKVIELFNPKYGGFFIGVAHGVAGVSFTCIAYKLLRLILGRFCRSSRSLVGPPNLIVLEKQVAELQKELKQIIEQIIIMLSFLRQSLTGPECQRIVIERHTSFEGEVSNAQQIQGPVVSDSRSTPDIEACVSNEQKEMCGLEEKVQYVKRDQDNSEQPVKREELVKREQVKSREGPLYDNWGSPVLSFGKVSWCEFMMG